MYLYSFLNGFSQGLGQGIGSFVSVVLVLNVLNSNHFPLKKFFRETEERVNEWIKNENNDIDKEYEKYDQNGEEENETKGENETKQEKWSFRGYWRNY